ERLVITPLLLLQSGDVITVALRLLCSPDILPLLRLSLLAPLVHSLLGLPLSLLVPFGGLLGLEVGQLLGPLDDSVLVRPEPLGGLRRSVGLLGEPALDLGPGPLFGARQSLGWFGVTPHEFSPLSKGEW